MLKLKLQYFGHLMQSAAAAKSLQSCPTLCNPIDGSPGFPVPGILQARTLEWVAVSFSNAWKWKVKVKLLSYVWLLGTPWTAAGNPSFPVLHYLLEFAQTHVHWADNAIQPSHPLSPLSPPAFNPSQQQGLFQWIGSLHQVAKVLELQLQRLSFQWILRTDFLTMDWSDLLAVQGTLKSLLQHHSSRASILWCSAFFIVHSHIHTWLLEEP